MSAIYPDPMVLIGTADATALDTGSFQTAGGASVKKNLWVGEDVNLATGKGVMVNANKVLGDRGAALTAADANAVNSGDATTDAVINNMRTRINELEARLSSAAGHGLIA